MSDPQSQLKDLRYQPVGPVRLSAPEGYGLIVNGIDVGRVAEIDPVVSVAIYKVAALAEGTEAATTPTTPLG